MSKTLDLGCGDVPRNPFHADEFFGVDVRSNLAGNIRSADLVVEPIPFDDESFDYLTAYDFIEHIPRVVYAPQRRNAFIEVMNEIHRVLKPGGLFLSHTPAYPHAVAFRDPTHVNIITEETFPLYFDDKVRWGAIYGFKGAFRVRSQEWRGPHLLTVLQKTAGPDDMAAAAAGHPAISVVIPVHNGEKFLARTLDSVLAQTFRDFELVCIDDGSTDGSAQILRDYAKADPRIRVVTTPHNLGSAPKALNHALGSLAGSYFVYSSQDDLFSPDWLESMHQRALETGADAVIPEVVLHHESEPAKDRPIIGLAGDRSAQLSGRDACLKSLDWTIPGNALWKADLVRRLGFEEFAVNSDEYSVRRFFLECSKVVFSGGRFLYRQDNPQAITKRPGVGRFDWPYTQLRVAQLLHEYGVAPTIVREQIREAAAAMQKLQRQLRADKETWSAIELAKVEAAIERFEQRLKLEHVISLDPPTPGRRRMAKWKKSLRKLPGKLGWQSRP